MKVTIITSLFTEWDMNIYSCHLFIYLLQILEKSVYDFDTILVSVLVITFVFTYYKTNYPFFFKKYFHLKYILYSSYKEDYFYRSSLLSSAHIIPIIIYSLIISFFYVYFFAKDEISTFLIEFEFSLFVVWIISFFIYLFYIPLRILIIKLIFLFINEAEKFKIIFLINFIRITILFSLINIFFSYLFYTLFSFDIAYSFFIFLGLFIILVRPVLLFYNTKKFYTSGSTKLIVCILFADLLPILFFLYGSYYFDLSKKIISIIGA